MKIFISWSGDRSKEVAAGLKTLIQDVVRCSEPWVSGADISPGARWSNVIQSELQETRFGILCLTRDNISAPWILFEAGALAKTVEDTFVCPYLVDLNAADIPQGPLSQFQAKTRSQDDTWELIRSINAAAKDASDLDADLRRRFDLGWSGFSSVLEAVPASLAPASPKRGAAEIAEETLVLVRHMAAQAEDRWKAESEVLVRLLASSDTRQARDVDLFRLSDREARARSGVQSRYRRAIESMGDWGGAEGPGDGGAA